jgi:hypothetical protein
MFALIAVVLFVLAAFGVRFDEVDIVALGLACVAAHLLIGAWPFGATPPWRRNP